ncbi:trypsin-1 [Hyalella azteca]|uniref:Trypsin-1 n=2 Tax=Hyalella azteca TaxID=294128 RepID=A0A8B7N6M8_HYAAZ|nr:trypsin-1 [Hyalella azteca]
MISKYFLVITAVVLGNFVHGAMRFDRLPGRHRLEGAKRCACSCGLMNRRRERLVGGEYAEFNEYPWVVALLLKGHYYCGGTLISDRYVLTAGHCVRGVNVKSLKVMVGEHMRSFPIETRSKAYQAVHYVVHPNFNHSNFESDIALVKLSDKVPYKWYARPACLPLPKRDYVGQLGLVAGWGRTTEKGEPSDLLKEILVPIFSNAGCRQLRYSDHEISDNMMCAGFTKGGTDSCHGDSGGPLMIRGKDKKVTVIGLVSWGEGCGRQGFPGVYTRVEKFLPWIEENTRDSCYCGSRTGRGL